jgi:hypothetical protein
MKRIGGGCGGGRLLKREKGRDMVIDDRGGNDIECAGSCSDSWIAMVKPQGYGDAYIHSASAG